MRLLILDSNTEIVTDILIAGLSFEVKMVQQNVELEKLLASINEEVPAAADLFGKTRNGSIKFRRVIKRGDPGFAPAVRDFIKENGYNIVEVPEEVIAEVKTILSSFPDSESKNAILSKIIKMPRLQLELVRDILRKGTVDPSAGMEFLNDISGHE